MKEEATLQRLRAVLDGVVGQVDTTEPVHVFETFGGRDFTSTEL
jgi:hypothetical protein